MARTRSLLHRIEVRPAGRLSHCARNRQHEILKGEPRFIIKDAGPAGGEKGYCVACGNKMVDSAESQLADLRGPLSQ